MTVFDHILVYGAKLSVKDVMHAILFHGLDFNGITAESITIGRDNYDQLHPDEYILLLQEHYDERYLTPLQRFPFPLEIETMVTYYLHGKPFSDEERNQIEETIGEYGLAKDIRYGGEFTEGLDSVNIPHDVLEWDRNEGETAQILVGWFLTIGNDLDGEESVGIENLDKDYIREKIHQYFPDKDVMFYQVQGDCLCCS
jgi:hypothetical protein